MVHPIDVEQVQRLAHIGRRAFLAGMGAELEAEFAGFLKEFIGSEFEFIVGAEEDNGGRCLLGEEAVRCDGLRHFQ